MSFKADFQLTLHIHDFFNLDLPSQGLFRLRASVYQQLSKSGSEETITNWGIPFELGEHPQKPSSTQRKIFFGS